MRTSERGLLVAVLGVLCAGVVSAAFVDDDADRSGPSAASPGPTLSAIPGTPTTAPSPTAGPLTVSGVRASSFAAGTAEVGVRFVAVVPGERVTGAQVDGQPPLTVGPGGEVTGTVSVACASRRTPVPLVVTTDAGRTLRWSLVLPAAAVDRACAPRTSGTPVPTASSRGS